MKEQKYTGMKKEKLRMKKEEKLFRFRTLQKFR